MAQWPSGRSALPGIGLFPHGHGGADRAAPSLRLPANLHTGAMAEQTLGHYVPGQYGGLFDPDLDDQLLVGEDPVGLVGLDVRNSLIALPCGVIIEDMLDVLQGLLAFGQKVPQRQGDEIPAGIQRQVDHAAGKALDVEEDRLAEVGAHSVRRVVHLGQVPAPREDVLLRVGDADGHPYGVALLSSVSAAKLNLPEPTVCCLLPCIRPSR